MEVINGPEVYNTEVDDLASVIAQYTCGIKDAIPEQADFDLATEVIKFIESRLKE